MEEHPGLPVSESNGEEKLAKWISVIFHPLLMPTYGFLLIFCTKNYISTFVILRYKIIIIGITFLFTFVFPAINAFVLLKMGRIRSLEMESIKERLIPYGTTALYYFALLYLFYHTGFLFIFKLILIGATSIIILTLLISTKWKISAHTAGIGGMAGAALGMVYRLQIDLELLFFIIILLAGVVGYARLRLKAHTPAQVYSGFLLGFLVQLIVVMLC
jgi:membrane-associated phospholipid phosphatase